MMRYLILRKKNLPANFEPASWFRPRRGTIKHVKRNKPAPKKRSAQKPWFRKIIEEQARRKSNKVVKTLEKAVDNQPSKPLPSYKRNNNTRVSRYGPTTHLLCKNSKTGPDETCPNRGVIYTQKVHGLYGKDKQLE